jgi:hypothetical protein
MAARNIPLPDSFDGSLDGRLSSRGWQMAADAQPENPVCIAAGAAIVTQGKESHAQ